MNFSPFFKVLDGIKVLHWITLHHSWHVELDECYEHMRSLVDKFVETAIGVSQVDQADMEVKAIILPSFSEFHDETEYFKALVDEFFFFADEMAGESRALNNILDDMHEECDHLLYFLGRMK